MGIGCRKILSKLFDYDQSPFSLSKFGECEVDEVFSSDHIKYEKSDQTVSITSRS